MQGHSIHFRMYYITFGIIYIIPTYFKGVTKTKSPLQLFSGLLLNKSIYY